MMGAAAFVMAEFLQVAYAEVVLAALIPAVLYYVALFIQADLFCGARRHQPGRGLADPGSLAGAQGGLAVHPAVTP